MSERQSREGMHVLYQRRPHSLGCTVCIARNKVGALPAVQVVRGMKGEPPEGVVASS